MKKKINKISIFLFLTSLMINPLFSQNTLVYEDLNATQKTIYDVEKAFNNMASTQGIAEAFKHFATKDAVIKREEILIKGKDKIYAYYKQAFYSKATVLWSPDVIDVADSGDLAYSYGKYVWKIPNAKGEIQEYTGIYLTIWQKQEDNSWKYVWD